MQLLDKTSPVPLYYQLLLRMQNDIQAGILRPGDLLGTERDIGERYDVSRATVRKALDELSRSGQVVRITGRGTFVAEPALNAHSPHLLSLTEELVQRGIVPGARVLAFGPIDAPSDVAVALGCRGGDQVLHVRRLRTADDLPVIVVDHYLHPTVRLAEEDLEQSLYETLEGRVGVRLQEALHTVRAGSASAEEAVLLDIQEGEPVLRFERTTLSAHGKPVVFERGTASSTHYEYSVHLFRR
jgi:GntR family transcriptional regulator